MSGQVSIVREYSEYPEGVESYVLRGDGIVGRLVLIPSGSALTLACDDGYLSAHSLVSSFEEFADLHEEELSDYFLEMHIDVDRSCRDISNAISSVVNSSDEADDTDDPDDAKAAELIVYILCGLFDSISDGEIVTKEFAKREVNLSGVRLDVDSWFAYDPIEQELLARGWTMFVDNAGSIVCSDELSVFKIMEKEDE